MKKILAALVVAVGVILGFGIYERLFVEKTIGPSAVLAFSLLALFFVLLLASLLLYDGRHRRSVGNFWLAIGSLGLTYIVVDLIAGMLLIRPLSPPLVPDDYRHHKLIPGTFSEFNQRDFHYVQRVNNLGLRGPDRPVQKPPGTYRILMLGDSFTMGKGVNDDETFSALLDGRLNARLGDCADLRVEVLNGGVDSYSPVLSYIQLSRELFRLEPDLVVFNLDVSDLVQEGIYRQLARYDDQGRPVAVPQPAAAKESFNERVRDWSEHHLYLTRLLFFYINRLFEYRDISPREVLTESNFALVAHTLQGDTVPRDRQWADIFDSILLMRDFSRDHGMQFVLTAYPWGHQVSDAEWQPGRKGMIPDGARVSDASIGRISAFAREKDVPFANMFPVFRSEHGGRPLYFQHDMHWTAAGHQVMARGLDEFLGPMVRASACR